ncbi:MAG: hypothetical protein ACLFSZ_10415, partial [Puniceicoccaceae bacterium]
RPPGWHPVDVFHSPGRRPVRTLAPMDTFININDWIGPFLAFGALATGAALLIGDYLWNERR